MQSTTDPYIQNVDPRVHKVEILISNLLRIGVGVSLTLVVFGAVVTFVHHPNYLHSQDDLSRLTASKTASFPTSLREVFDGLAAFHGQAIVVLGLLCLICTPVVRVAISIFAFLYQKDRVFVFITALVLTLLIVSFFLGKVE